MTVATSDATEQVIILGQGARRLSARDLLEEVMAASAEIRSMYLNKEKGAKSYLLEHLPEKEKRRMEDIRLGKEESYE